MSRNKKHFKQTFISKTMQHFYTDDDDDETDQRNLFGNTINASFVSIDLNEDKNECDICHQTTEESIANVMLSDKYLKFEGSLIRNGARLTKAHHICLERWSEVIERNITSLENMNIDESATKTTTSNKNADDIIPKNKDFCAQKERDSNKEDLCFDLFTSQTMPKGILFDKGTNYSC